MKTNTVVMKALNSLIEEHLAAMEVRHYSANTLRTRRFLLRAFTQWCGSREIRVTVQFRKKDIEDYQAHLHSYCKHSPPGDHHCDRLTIRGQQMRLSAVRVFLAWLTKTGVLATNPAAEVETLREDHRLPRQILTAPEVEKALDGINTRSLTGLRDRAILETLYSTGMRRSELLALTVHDVSLESGVVRINNGKGARDRVVPIGQRALAWINRYLQEVRPLWTCNTTVLPLFLTSRGTSLSGNHVSLIARRHIDRSKLGKRGSCHLFRHSCATVLLQNGADIRSIQELLGHASLETTQIYTQVTVMELKRVHNRCHPLAQDTSYDAQSAKANTDDHNHLRGATKPSIGYAETVEIHRSRS